jgi:translation initiation factor IF-2
VGTVLEAELDRGRGPVATVLVQNGTLRVGDFFICGQVFGKVRAMYDHFGAQVREAPPSTPVEVLGLNDLPDVGDAFQVVTDTAKAKQIVMYREVKSREQAMSKGMRITLEQFNQQAKEGDVKDLNVIVKTDVGGTAEVLSEMLQKLSTEKVRISQRTWARSPNPTCFWRLRPVRSSSASTSVPSAAPQRSPRRKRSTSVCTRSFTS